jgi:hypothetical protein
VADDARAEGAQHGVVGPVLDAALEPVPTDVTLIVVHDRDRHEHVIDARLQPEEHTPRLGPEPGDLVNQQTQARRVVLRAGSHHRGRRVHRRNLPHRRRNPHDLGHHRRRRRRLNRSLTLPDAQLIATPQAYPLLCINELDMCYFVVGWTAAGTPVGAPESAITAMGHTTTVAKEIKDGKLTYEMPRTNVSIAAPDHHVAPKPHPSRSCGVASGCRGCNACRRSVAWSW